MLSRQLALWEQDGTGRGQGLFETGNYLLLGENLKHVSLDRRWVGWRWVCDDFRCHSFGGWDAPVKEEEEVKIEQNMPALLCLDGRRTDWVDL